MKRYVQKNMKPTRKNRQAWLRWLAGYGAEKFLDAFLQTVEGAESICAQCHEPIFVDVLIGGGTPDWSTTDGDFGCADSPDTCEDGTGGHVPRRRP